jgi:hypothetical protein
MTPEIRQLLKEFVKETEAKRTQYNGAASSIRPPTFADFLVWLEVI